MNYNSIKYWLIYVLIIGILVRQNIGVSSTTTDIPTSTLFQQTSQALVSTNLTAIYVITSYNDPYMTMQTSMYPVTTQSTSTTTTDSGTGLYVITSFHGYNITTPTQSLNTTSTPPTQINCDDATHVWSNGTCANRTTLLNSSLSIINSSTANATEKAYAISTYITAISNTNTSLYSNYTIPLGQLNQILKNLNSPNYIVNTSDSIIIITEPDPCNNRVTIIGGASSPNRGSTIISTDNLNGVIQSNLLAAGYIYGIGECNKTSVDYFNILIINDRNIYQKADNSSNATLVSSIIIATVSRQSTNIDTDRGKAVSNSENITIDLYFRVEKSHGRTVDGKYICAFFDTNTSQWNESGCGPAKHNLALDRYECKCNHLTSFALIWLPYSSQNTNNSEPINVKLNAQDIVSLISQLLSIVCFAGIIVHGLIVYFYQPGKYHLTSHLLPIISFGVTMLLFIFYIALSLTVYSRYAGTNPNVENSTDQGRNLQADLKSDSIPRIDNSSEHSSPPYIRCLSNEYGLMFTVYFFLILMFCTKTSIGIDNYRRYVQLMPPPTFRMLVILLIISVIISGILVLIAAVLNADPLKEIAGIYGFKLCWFTRTVIHYFLTIPACLFLIINIFVFIFVVKHNITHAVIKDEDRHYYTRRKRCVYILLASCITQGLGWIVGPLILVADENAANVLGWVFIIFNALEGVWTIIIYIIVDKEGINTKKQHPLPTEPAQFDNLNLIDNQVNEIANDRRHNPLADVRSDSPRNSFTEFELRERHNIH